MVKFFSREFIFTGKELLQDLNTLEAEGAVYNYFWRDVDGRFVYTRLRLTPAEIVEYVDAACAYEEFLMLLNLVDDPSAALSGISDARMRKRVEEYNTWTISINQLDTAFCFAAFLGDHLEGLVSGIVKGRHEVFAEKYSGDRRFLLREILELFPQSASQLRQRTGNRPSFEIEQEQDVRDLLYAIIKCVFPDALIEEPARKHAGSAKRIDVVLPSISTVVEIKYVRDPSHSRKVADELKIDFESYHTHPDCKTLIAYVWDPANYLSDRTVTTSSKT